MQSALQTSTIILLITLALTHVLKGAIHIKIRASLPAQTIHKYQTIRALTVHSIAKHALVIRLIVLAANQDGRFRLMENAF